MSRSEQLGSPPPANRPRFPGRGLLLAWIMGLCLAWITGTWAGNVSGATEFAPQPLNLSQPRVVVVKSSAKLFLYDANDLVRIYPIQLGPDPTGQKRMAGDGRTPEGTFRICTKNRQSRNHRFLGIDYPNQQAARRGLRSGLTTVGESTAILDAHRQGRCPNWATALGGAIGLHGGAFAGEPTAGCIALSEAHIHELFEVLRVGDEIEILP